MANKEKSLSFRVPAEIRRALEWGVKQSDPQLSQSDFITEAVMEFIDRVDENATLQDLMLPEDFQIPKKDSKMVTIRVSSDLPERIRLHAPRLYHSAARLILWATQRRAYELAEKRSARKNQ